MDWPTLDTRWWNLSLGVVATTMMAACGPTIILDEEESITDSDGPDVPPNTTVPPRGECQVHADCEPGNVCIDNVCMPDDTYYCDDSGCCNDYGYDCCYGDCCYYGDDCYYYEECFEDAQCGFGEVCEYFACQPVEFLPACEQPDLTALPLPAEDDDPIISLSFVDGAGSGDEAEDLLVGRASGARLHRGSDGAVVDLPLPEGEVVLDAVSGDFDADGDRDLAFTDGADSITILLGNELGEFELGSTIDVGTAITHLEALQWNSDGAVDLAGLTVLGTTVLHLGDGMGGLQAGMTVEGNADTYSLASGRFNDDELEDLIAHDGGRSLIFLGNDEQDVAMDGALPDREVDNPTWGRRLLVGDVDGVGFSEVIGHTNMDSGWLLFETWSNGFDRQAYALEEAVEHGDLGDYDGDGDLDVVLAGGDRLTFVRAAPGGSSTVVECQAQLSIGVDVEQLAVGDFSGDGRAQIAIAHDAQVLLFSAE